MVVIMIYVLAGVAIAALFYFVYGAFSPGAAVRLLLICHLVFIVFAGMIAIGEGSSGYFTRAGVFVLYVMFFGGPLFVSSGAGVLIAWGVARFRERNVE